MLHDWTERLGQTKKGCLGKTTVEPSSIDYTSYMYICLVGPSVEGLEDEISLAAYGQTPTSRRKSRHLCPIYGYRWSRAGQMGGTTKQ